MSNLILRGRRLLITLMHAVLVELSLAAALLLRFEFSLSKDELPLLWQGLTVVLLPKLLAFYLVRSDRGSWRYAGVPELYRLAIANAVGSAAFALSALWFIGPAFPRSVYCIDFLICFLATSVAQMSVRLYIEIRQKPSHSSSKRVLIYGAGAAGRILWREIRSNPALQYQVIGFLDDDANKAGMNILGTIVLGRGRDAAIILDRFKKKRAAIHEIIIAMPSASGVQMRNAVANCRSAGVLCRTIPGVGELLASQVLTQQIRNVKVEDLLGRQPVQLDAGLVRSSMEGQSVMVTGGGGSIGSELCRQVASFGPAKLVIFEQSEAALYTIHQELIRTHPNVAVIPSLGDIKDYSVLAKAIRQNGIRSIFHAAAYKHVPMMEMHLLQAVKNNILGTRNLARAAYYNQVSQVLMISSDKAVNPTNIMGLTKRVAELTVSAMPLPSEGSATKFCSVRFGNVLGSSGSVVPMFERQIATGGPVTVTHPDMQRYFMTVREAVQLVLQASTMGNGSEVFVLDMGEPVKIVELARNMIRLAGREPGVDIEIRFTGVRPGEKLYEELLLGGENILPTNHKKIRTFSGPRKSAAVMENWIAELEKLAADEDESAIVTALAELVPEYQPSVQWLERIQPASESAGRPQLAARVAGVR